MNRSIQSFREFLMQEWLRRQKRNRRYSLRTFAKSLGISPSRLSEYFNGKASFSPERAMALSARLGIQDQSEYIDLLILKEFARSRSARQGASQKLKKEKGRYSYSKSVFSKDIQSINWDHLCVVEVLQKPHSVEELARRFNQTTPYINSILSDARRIGLVSQLTNGMWKALDFSRLFEGPGASATLRRLHYQFLDKARRNAEVCAFEDRELNSSLVLLTSEQVQAVRKLVRKFAREVLAEGSDQNNSKLYGLGIQLFPIEKLGD